MRVEARLLVPDPDERKFYGNRRDRSSTRRCEHVGAVELVEIEQALSCGERSRAVIAEEYGVSERTIERMAARMRAAGKRVRPFEFQDYFGSWGRAR